MTGHQYMYMRQKRQLYLSRRQPTTCPVRGIVPPVNLEAYSICDLRPPKEWQLNAMGILGILGMTRS